MKIAVRSIGGVKILDCSGKITLGEDTQSIRKTVADLLQTGSKNILLNFAEVGYIDSSGIGELVSTYTTVSNSGGRLKLLNLTKRIRQLLAITKLLTVFETFENEEAALESY
jgi:anti-sigma B factor antagonist